MYANEKGQRAIAPLAFREAVADQPPQTSS